MAWGPGVITTHIVYRRQAGWHPPFWIVVVVVFAGFHRFEEIIGRIPTSLALLNVD
jgi:small neutral amino acid transporter SnatA (MarC family)